MELEDNFFGSGEYVTWPQGKMLSVLGAKLEWTCAAPSNRHLEQLHVSRCLQGGALLNYTLQHTFLSTLRINLLPPPSGNLNLVQVNCFIPLSRCPKKPVTFKIKANVPSQRWDKHPTRCTKYNLSWRVCAEGLKCIGIVISFSPVRKFQQ